LSGGAAKLIFSPSLDKKDHILFGVQDDELFPSPLSFLILTLFESEFTKSIFFFFFF